MVYKVNKSTEAYSRMVEAGVEMYDDIAASRVGKFDSLQGTFTYSKISNSKVPYSMLKMFWVDGGYINSSREFDIGRFIEERFENIESYVEKGGFSSAI